MEGTEREGVQHLDSGRDVAHNRGRHLGLLANVARSNKCSDSLPSSAPSAVLSLEPLGRRDAAWPGPARLTVSTRSTMPYQLVAPLTRDALPRGVYCDAFPDRLEYYVVTSWGERRPSVRCDIDMEQASWIIADLWDALERDDRQPPSFSAAPRREPGSLRLVGRD
jgi:hypothetical protein